MIQFYFLSILFNVVGGFALAFDKEDRTKKHRVVVAAEELKASLSDPTVRLVIGILSVVTGAFKLLAVVRGDIPVVGDFLPVATGIAVGATLILELYRSEASPPHDSESFGEGADIGSNLFGIEEIEDSAVKSKNEKPDLVFSKNPIELLLLRNKKTIGLSGMIAGLVHFLFPAVLFL